MEPGVERIVRGLCRRDGALLLCINPRAGYRYLPGGHVEEGESSKQALEREFLEELGWRIRVGPPVAVAECSFTQEGLRRREVSELFLVEQFDEPPSHGPSPVGPDQITTREPNLAFEWAPLATIGSLDLRPAIVRDWLAQAPDPLGAGPVVRLASQTG